MAYRFWTDPNRLLHMLIDLCRIRIG